MSIHGENASAADRAKASLSPRWVTQKEFTLAQWTGMYAWLGAVDNAFAGIPGWWKPDGGSTMPANAANASSITANPATAWTTGQFVRATLTEIYWDGAAWQDGVAA